MWIIFNSTLTQHLHSTLFSHRASCGIPWKLIWWFISKITKCWQEVNICDTVSLEKQLKVQILNKRDNVKATLKTTLKTSPLSRSKFSIQLVRRFPESTIFKALVKYINIF